MLGHKTQKVDAARSAASTFWVLVCLNTKWRQLYPKSVVRKILVDYN
jgi:hypothetical protein